MRDVIRSEMICYRHSRYLHDVPECLLVKNCPTPQDYLSRWLIKFRTQYNTKTGPQTDDVWRILERQREREAVATDFLRRPYATPEWRWFIHANKIYGIAALMLNGLHQNMPVFLDDNFLILEHNVSFGHVPFLSSVLIYEYLPQGKQLSYHATVAQQRESRPGFIALSHRYMQTTKPRYMIKFRTTIFHENKIIPVPIFLIDLNNALSCLSY